MRDDRPLIRTRNDLLELIAHSLRLQLSYLSDTEPSALEQFYSAMELDCVVRGALMADAHTGYSLPIGGVVATDGVVFPAWVGFDIGCGVCAVQVPSTKREALEAYRKQIFESVYRSVPTGMGGMHKRDGCYSTIGKGVEEALWSSSHGAGRAMSRQKAQKDITLEDFQATMAAVTAKVDDSTKDEAPFAYKNFAEVMKNQEGLLEVIAHVKPIINIKG